MKKILFLVLSVVLVLSLSACTSYEEEYISGVSFDPAQYDTTTYARYENKLHGIIIEYPETYERVGNFDLDGFISFENSKVSISVYAPDTENNDILTAEEYTLDILELSGEVGSGNTKYGKSSGYKSISYDDEGHIRIDFIVKGVDAFHRFAYTTVAKDFTEEDFIFQAVMGSIRIDDGILNRLSRMSNRYSLLLEYAMSMQYITDANYVNHCLNNYEGSKDERNKQEALSTMGTIREEMQKILDHEREEGEGYDDRWQEIIAGTEKVVASCDEVVACIERGDYAGAQKIARTGFEYKLSEDCEDFIAAINAEISEY